jgi:AcrR family transcriptional regulator
VVKGEQQELRRNNAANPDPRATRTRARLIKAFLDTAEEPDVEAFQLTPAELASRAGVNRTTFYAHFASTDDLAVEALAELFLVVASDDAAGRREHHALSTSRASLQEVAAFVGSRRSIYRHLLLSGQSRFRSALEEQFTERNRQTLAAMRNRPPHVDVEVTAHWVASAVMGVIAWWLADGVGDGGEPLGVDALAENLVRLLPEWFVDDESTDRL